MRISNHGTEMFSSYDSRKSRNEICVSHDLTSDIVIFGGAELVWPSNHFRLWYSALHMQKET